MVNSMDESLLESEINPGINVTETLSKINQDIADESKVPDDDSMNPNDPSSKIYDPKTHKSKDDQGLASKDPLQISEAKSVKIKIRVNKV